MNTRFTIAAAMAGTLLLARCGPRFTIEPLTGEDPDVVAMLGGASAQDTPEPVRFVERFYRALRSDHTSEVWAMLADDTKVALDSLAATIDQNGRHLLSSRYFPVKGAAAGTTQRVSLTALFLVNRPTSFSLASKDDPGAMEAKVVVANVEGDRRETVLRRERGDWRVLRTDYATLPVEVDVSKGLLPAKPVAPEPKPEPKAEPKTEPEPEKKKDAIEV